jgi:hypothetical protein
MRLVERSGGEEACSHQHDPEPEERLGQPGTTDETGGHHRSGSDREGGQPERGRPRVEAEHSLCVEDEEEGQRRVSHDPQDLGGQQCPHAGSDQR